MCVSVVNMRHGYSSLGVIGIIFGVQFQMGMLSMGVHKYKLWPRACSAMIECVRWLQVMGTAFFGEDELQFSTLDRAASVLFFALMGEVRWTSIEAWAASEHHRQA